MFLEYPLVPKNPDGKLRTVIPGRVSTIVQDIECIAVTQDGNEEWLAKVWNGLVDVVKLGEQASGWLVDRPSMERATHLIESGQCDLVLMGEIRELYRNPRLIWQFIQNCLDHDTRVISRYDRIDTAVDGWESAVNDACGRYGSTRPETRRRVRGKAAHEFKRGGMVMKTKFGYRKLTKEEANSGMFGPIGLRIAKIPECTETIREMRRRVLAKHSDVMVADWLIGEGVTPGPYATEWSGQLVRELLTDPILSGLREFRKTISKLIYGRGKNRSDRNPSPLQSEKCSELAHLTVDEQEDLLRFYCQRKAKNHGAQKSGKDSPLYKQPRGVSLWPGQSLVCSACQGKFYVCGSTMKCQHALPKNPGDCWNHVVVSTQAVRDAVLPVLLAAVERDPTAKAKLLATMWDEYQTRRRKWSSTQSADEMDLVETNRQIAIMLKALKQDGDLDSVREELTALEKKKKAITAKLAKRTSPEFEFGEYASAEAMGGDLPRVLDLMARTSRPFALLLRRLLPECAVVPVQALDSGLVRPRLKFTISFAPWASPVEPAFEDRHEVDLFTPPLHIRHVGACRSAQRDYPDKTLRELETVLGINYMTIKRAIDYSRLMDREGLTEPYRVLTEAPASASRWHKHRPKTTDEPPGSILDENV